MVGPVMGKTRSVARIIFGIPIATGDRLVIQSPIGNETVERLINETPALEKTASAWLYCFMNH